MGCSVDGCDRQATRRGWCDAHYRRWYVHGDVRADEPIQRPYGEGHYKYDSRIDEMSDVEVAWCAGIFEGEGCMYAGGPGNPVAILSSTDRDVVEKFARYTDGVTDRVVGPHVNKSAIGTKPTFRVNYSGEQAVDLIQKIYEHLGARRREQADNALRKMDRKVG